VTFHPHFPGDATPRYLKAVGQQTAFCKILLCHLAVSQTHIKCTKNSTQTSCAIDWPPLSDMRHAWDETKSRVTQDISDEKANHHKLQQNKPAAWKHARWTTQNLKIKHLCMCRTESCWHSKHYCMTTTWPIWSCRPAASWRPSSLHLAMLQHQGSPSQPTGDDPRVDHATPWISQLEQDRAYWPPCR